MSLHCLVPDNLKYSQLLTLIEPDEVWSALLLDGGREAIMKTGRHQEFHGIKPLGLN